MWFNNIYAITGTGTGITAVINGGTGLGTIPTNGQLLIGNGTGYSLRTLTAGTNISITNGSGTISIASTGVGFVTATAPLVSSGGTTPNLSIPVATTSANGYLSSTDWTIFNNKGSGTVTSVAALTLGTSGTNLSSTVATGTTTPVITLNVPTASATNRGALSAADWTTFNGKGTGTVTSVATAGTVNGLTLTGGPITASGTVTLGGTLDLSSPPAIGSTAASTGAFTTLSATTVNIAASAANAGLTLLRDTGTATRSSRIFFDSSSGITAIYNNANSILFNTSATIGSSSGSNQFLVSHTASAVDYVQVTGGTTATKIVTISAQGSDTDVDLALTPKGTGRVRFGTYTAVVTAVAGYIEVKDSGGTLRKLAVLT
jgi:hypothetical protein